MWTRVELDGHCNSRTDLIDGNNVRVDESRIQVFVGDKQVIDYTEPTTPIREPARANRLLDSDGGAIALQAHDPNSIFYFKQIRIRELK